LGQIDAAMTRLTDMGTLYSKTDLVGKQTLLLKVFELGMSYDGRTVRTPHIHSALMQNYSKINEKGLLLVEQPEGFEFILRSCTA
jgi:hypothetical protein